MSSSGNGSTKIAQVIYKNKQTGEWDIELLELMRESGCVWVYIGFESVNPAALEAYRKQQTIVQIADSIRAFHAYDIPVHGMFVPGCDADTPETVYLVPTFLRGNVLLPRSAWRGMAVPQRDAEHPFSHCYAERRNEIRSMIYGIKVWEVPITYAQAI